MGVESTLEDVVEQGQRHHATLDGSHPAPRRQLGIRVPVLLSLPVGPVGCFVEGNQCVTIGQSLCTRDLSGGADRGGYLRDKHNKKNGGSSLHIDVEYAWKTCEGNFLVFLHTRGCAGVAFHAPPTSTACLEPTETKGDISFVYCCHRAVTVTSRWQELHGVEEKRVG